MNWSLTLTDGMTFSASEDKQSGCRESKTEEETSKPQLNVHDQVGHGHSERDDKLQRKMNNVAEERDEVAPVPLLDCLLWQECPHRLVVLVDELEDGHVNGQLDHGQHQPKDQDSQLDYAVWVIVQVCPHALPQVHINLVLGIDAEVVVDSKDQVAGAHDQDHGQPLTDPEVRPALFFEHFFEGN